MLTLIISRMKKKNKRMARHKEKRRQKRGVRRTSADGKRDKKASDVRGEANGTRGVLDVRGGERNVMSSSGVVIKRWGEILGGEMREKRLKSDNSDGKEKEGEEIDS